MTFFETFPECSLPSTVSKNTIKLIGHHSRLRDVMRANLLPFVSVIVLITRVIHRSTLHFAAAQNIVYKSNTREKNLTGRKCRVYRTISFKICGNSTIFETTWT